MTTIVNHIPNEQQLRRTFGGTEVTLGVKVAPTFKLYGDMVLNKARPLADREEYAGTFFSDYTKVRGAAVIDGTYAQPLSFEDGPLLGRYCLVGGGAGVTDGNTTPGYTYVQEPNPTVANLDFMSGEYGAPGLGPFEYTGLFFPEFTISGDIDNAEACWMWNSRVLALTKTLKDDIADTATGGTTTTVVKTAAGWSVNGFAGAYVRMTGGTAANIGQIRRIPSNTATALTVDGAFPQAVASGDTFVIDGVMTAGINDRTRETIDFPGTHLTIDDQGAIGTTPVLGRFISFSTTFTRTSNGKRFAEDRDGYSRFGFGRFRVTGQVRLEFDSRAEYEKWESGESSAIRIWQEGSEIDSGAGTNKLAQIDIYDAAWDAFPFDTRENNITATITYRGYVDATEGIPGGLTWKNTLATLP